MQDSIMVSRRLNHLEKIWPQLLTEMVTKYVGEMEDLDSYCKHSLDSIRKS